MSGQGALLGMSVVTAIARNDINAMRTVIDLADDNEIDGAFAWLAQWVATRWEDEGAEMGLTIDDVLEQRGRQVQRLAGLMGDTT